MDRNYDLISLISKGYILRRHREAIFAGIIKILTMFIKTIFKNSRKVKRIRTYVSNCSLYLYFLMQQNLLIFIEKMLISAELKGCVPWLIYFWAMFHHCRICMTDFMEKGLSPLLPPSLSSPKKAHPEES